MRKNNKKSQKKTNHHIIPSSRGGSSRLENIARVTGRNHEYYHALFQNMTPEEIVKDLVNNYWNGNWKYVAKAYDSENNY